MKHLTKIGGIFIALVALALLAGTTFTFAQDDGTDSTVPESETEGRGNRGHDIIDRGAVKEAISDTIGLTEEEVRAMKAEGMSFEEILEAQGVTQEDVQAAVLAVVEEAVETAVADGSITQEQADQILARAAEGGFKFGRGGGKRGGHGFGEIFGDLDRQAILADALGITVEELEAYHADGLRLSEIAEEVSVDLADVEEAIKSAMTDAINQAVEDGTITQEQADQLLERVEEGKFGRGGHRGPRGGGFNNDAPTNDAQDA